MQKGFSLVELSIVLVILGLLTGGILSGQALIQAAALNSVVTESQNYISAIDKFRLKYFARPGDFKDATRFWTAAHTSANTCRDMDKSGGTATCNGDGDGTIDANNEMYLFWHHLANAGLIKGNYEGRSDPDIGVNSWAHTPGKNCPASRFSSGTGYGIRWQGTQTSNSWFHGEYGHLFMFGKGVNTANLPRGAALEPVEIWKLDTKFDDGKPAYGQLVTRAGLNPETPDCTESSPGAADVTHGGTDMDAVYRFDIENPACVLIIRNVMER